MFKKFSKNKVLAYGFVLFSLGIFLAVGALFLDFYVNAYFFDLQNRRLEVEASREIQADISDPYLTKVPKASDYIKAPVINESSPVLGQEEAETVLVVYSDYDCAYCREQVASISDFAVGKEAALKVVWKDYPDKPGTDSYVAALSARCAGEQDKFWEFNASLVYSELELKDINLIDIANKIGLNIEAWEDCRSSGRGEALIDADIYEANALKISGVPYVYVNEYEFLGGIEISELESLMK